MTHERMQIAVGFRVSVEMVEWLEQQAAAALQPVSKYVALALEQHRKQLEAASAKST